MDSEKIDFIKSVDAQSVAYIVDVYRKSFHQQKKEIESSEDSEENKKNKIKACMHKNRRMCFEDIYLLTYQHSKGCYVLNEHLKEVFRMSDNQIKSNVQRARVRLLDTQGLLLSNKVDVGYRLGVEEDIPVEMSKSALRSFGAINSLVKIYIKTKAQHGQLSAQDYETAEFLITKFSEILPRIQNIVDDLDDKGAFLKAKESLDKSKALFEKIGKGGETL